MSYLEYLKRQGIVVFQCKGTDWYVYNKSLIPVSPFPQFFNSLSLEDAKDLLRRSGAYLIRWSSCPVDYQTAWWWIICDQYDQSTLSKKTRYGIRRGKDSFTIRRMTSLELVSDGYDCYRNAYLRYTDAQPLSLLAFQTFFLSASEDLGFEYWGIFERNNLQGFVQCIVEEKGVSTSIVKLDPDGLLLYSSYVLYDAILNYYINNKNLPVSNGTRSVFHDTNIQEFLLKFGFRRQYCKLDVVYSLPVNFLIKSLFLFRKPLSNIHGVPILKKLNGLLFQEELRRSTGVSIK